MFQGAQRWIDSGSATAAVEGQTETCQRVTIRRDVQAEHSGETGYKMAWTVTAENYGTRSESIRFDSHVGAHVTFGFVYKLVAGLYDGERPGVFRFLEDEYRNGGGQHSVRAGVESIPHWAGSIRTHPVATSKTGHVRIDYDRGALVMTRHRHSTRAKSEADEDSRQYDMAPPDSFDEFITALWNELDLIVIPVGKVLANGAIDIVYLPEAPSGGPDCYQPPAPSRSRPLISAYIRSPGLEVVDCHKVADPTRSGPVN